MSRRLLSLWALMTVAGSTASACSNTYNDEAFGVLDLPGTPPTQVLPEDGFEGTGRAEYYNLGAVATLQNAFGEPISARVNPMYFFFTPDGKPLLAPVVRETRTRQDFITGGQDVVSIDPKDFCAVQGADPVSCKALNDRQLDRPYSVRFRESLIDVARGSADYQRPIVDVAPTDLTGVRGIYSGVWEIVEVTVPADYTPDAVKHLKTLKKALDEGDFKERRTGKAINCPFIDERTQVSQGVADAATPRPRMEIWYRNKLAFCFLADGWATLGDAAGVRYPANSDAQRLDIFDVARVGAGEGRAQENLLVVPVGKAFVPTRVTIDNPDKITQSRVRVGGQILTSGRPRRTPADPPGYTPIRWLWDINVRGEYKEDSLNDVAKLDQDGQTQPLDPTVAVNLPSRGIKVPCSYKKQPYLEFGLKVEWCGVVRSDDVRPDPSGDPTCTALGLECDKRTCVCDSPPVTYGQRCGVGIARCNEEKDGFSDKGYRCFPRTVGFCYLACDVSKPNMLESQNRGREPKDFVDSRCKELPGYSCFTGLATCLRFCDESILDTESMKQCRAVVDVNVDGMATPKDIGVGQQCQNFGVQICSWPDDYSPRN